KNKELLSQLASSTRLDPMLCGTKQRHINFQDTFRLDYYNPDNASSSPIVDTKNAEKSRQRPSHKSSPLSTTTYETSRGGEASSGPGLVLNTSTYHSDVGAIVRKWKVEFNGEKGSSVDEFIQRVDECRRLARLSDEDLLNSITELLTGQARLWCRQERSQWKKWEDFCIAARRCYGIDRRYQQKLELEAQRRTQGKTEPVNHYVYCVCSRSSANWRSRGHYSEKLDLLHNNMLPSLQKQVPRYKARSINEFVELARDAENLHSAEKLYQPPIPSNLSMMPETAWDEPEAREKTQLGEARVAVGANRRRHRKDDREAARSEAARTHQRLQQRRRPRVTGRTTRKGRCHPRIKPTPTERRARASRRVTKIKTGKPDHKHKLPAGGAAVPDTSARVVPTVRETPKRKSR
ncbi:unnamed protein product, partial [Trichogramma brassicae]